MLDHPDYVDHVFNCPICMKEVVKKWMKKVGSFTSKKKAIASKENGKLGGRPSKKKD